jgi:hypothetical protein
VRRLCIVIYLWWRLSALLLLIVFLWVMADAWCAHYFFNSAGNTNRSPPLLAVSRCKEQERQPPPPPGESFMSSWIRERNLNEPLVPLLFYELLQYNSLFIQALHTYDDSYRRNGVLLRAVSLCRCRHERATHVSLFAELCASFERYNEETRTSLGEWGECQAMINVPDVSNLFY